MKARRPWAFALAALLLAPLLGAMLPTVAGAAPVVYEATLIPSDGAPHNLASGIALSGDTAILGAQGASSFTGAAYVFVRSGTTWTEQAKLVAADAAADSAFGFAVAIEGDTAVVSARADDHVKADAGSVYVFTRSGTTWTQQAKLAPADLTQGATFGASVAISGDTILVGAHSDAGTGSAYVFVGSGATWTQQAKLLPPPSTAPRLYGFGAALIGDTAVVGSPGNSGESGNAFVYTRSGTSWSLQQTLGEPDGAAGRMFGWGVALTDERAVFGAPLDETAGSASGSAHVFARTGAAWTHEAKLLPAGGAAGNGFGTSVAAHDDVVLVGSPEDDARGLDSGAAHLFVHANGAWSEREKLVAPVGVSRSYFGTGAALTSDTAIVSASFNNGQGSGRAYVFRADTTAPVVSSAPDQTAEATGPDGAVVEYATPTAVDAVDGARPVTCAPTSGATFPLGVTQVMCTASDRSGNEGMSSFTVTVQDTTAPDFAQPEDITAVANETDGAPVVYQTPVAYDAVAGPRPVACAPESGSLFAIGDTRVTCAAADDAGNTKTRTFTVSVLRAPDDGLPDAFEAKLLPTGAAYSAGVSVAIHGDAAVFGDPASSARGIDAGAAFVHERIGTAWSEAALLAPQELQPQDAFGKAVAIDGNTVVVGSPGVSAINPYSGSAYVFVRDANGWSQQARLTSADAASNAGFGGAVAISGDTIVIGSPLDVVGGTRQGALYVFVRDAGVWTQQARLVAPDGEALDVFGSAVAVSGGTLVAGSRYDASPAGADSGSAYVFVRSGDSWALQAKLEPPAGEWGGEFGLSVAVHADTVLIGSPRNAERGDRSGAAFVFVRSGGAWTPQAKLMGADTNADDEFGHGVALDGDVAVVGAPFDDSAGTRNGSAYVFARSGGAWSQHAKLIARGGDEMGRFGYSAAVSGDTAIVGRPDGGIGSDLGGALVFAPDRTPPVIAPRDDVRVNATDSSGTVVTYDAPRWTDVADGEGVATCEPASGSTFPMSATLVTCTAADAADNRATSTFRVIVEAVAPPAPQNLRAHGGIRNVTLAWDAPATDGGAPLTGYAVYRDGVLLALDVSGTTWVDEHVEDHASFTYGVAARNAAGESEPAMAVGTALGPPSAPEALVAQGGVGNVTLAWDAPASDGGVAIDGYTIYRDGAVIASLAADAREWVDEGLSNTDSFVYAVTAANAAGEGPAAETTGGPIPPPTAPRNLLARNGAETGTVELTWEAPEETHGLPVLAYRVWRLNDTNASAPTLALVGETQETSYTDTGCRLGVTCTYVVSAVTAAGEGAASSAASAAGTEPFPATVPATMACAVYGRDQDGDGRAEEIVVHTCTWTITRDGIRPGDGREEIVSLPIA